MDDIQSWQIPNKLNNLESKSDNCLNFDIDVRLSPYFDKYNT